MKRQFTKGGKWDQHIREKTFILTDSKEEKQIKVQD